MIGYRDLRARMADLSPEAQADVARRFAAYRRKVWRAGHPWTWWALATWALAFITFVAPQALGVEGVGLFAPLALLSLGLALDRAAARKKRAYEVSHPFGLGGAA